VDRQTYDSYLRLFNARDYDGVLTWFAPQFEIRFGGYSLTTRTQAGFERLLTPAAGETIVIPQFIHYHLEGGKFARALCAIV
jgi:hypothetical protein